MSEVVKPDFLEVVFLYEPGEVFCHIVGAYDLSALIDADIFQIIQKDCTPKELRLLIDLVRAMKASMRNRNYDNAN